MHYALPQDELNNVLKPHGYTKAYRQGGSLRGATDRGGPASSNLHWAPLHDWVGPAYWCTKLIW